MNGNVGVPPTTTRGTDKPDLSSSRRSRVTGSNAASDAAALALTSASRMWPSYACSPPGVTPGSPAISAYREAASSPGENPRAMHARVEIDEQLDRVTRAAERLRQPPHDPFIVHDGGEGGRRIPGRELPETIDVGTDRLIREQHVPTAALGEHLGLGDCRALELADPEHELSPDHLRQLVCFHVRPEAIDTTGHADHVADVLVYTFEVHQQRRGGDLVDVGDLIPLAAMIRGNGRHDGGHCISQRAPPQTPAVGALTIDTCPTIDGASPRRNCGPGSGSKARRRGAGLQSLWRMYGIVIGPSGKTATGASGPIRRSSSATAGARCPASAPGAPRAPRLRASRCKGRRAPSGG